jgi:hypothetical protein
LEQLTASIYMKFWMNSMQQKVGGKVPQAQRQAAIGDSGIGDPAAVIRAGGKRKLRGGSQGRKAQEKDPEHA